MLRHLSVPISHFISWPLYCVWYLSLCSWQAMRTVMQSWTSPPVLASDWLRVITWPGDCPLIGHSPCRLFVWLHSVSLLQQFIYLDLNFMSQACRLLKGLHQDWVKCNTGPIRGRLSSQVITLDQSEASIQCTWSLSTNHRPGHSILKNNASRL